MEITTVRWKQNSKLTMHPRLRKKMMHLLKFQKNCQVKWQVYW